MTVCSSILWASHLPIYLTLAIYNIRGFGKFPLFATRHLISSTLPAWSNTKDLQWLFCKQYSQQQIWVSPKLGAPPPQTNSLNCWVLVWNHIWNQWSFRFPAATAPQGCCCPNCRQERPGLIRPGCWSWCKDDRIFPTTPPKTNGWRAPKRWALEKVTGSLKNSNFWYRHVRLDFWSVNDFGKGLSNCLGFEHLPTKRGGYMIYGGF